MRTVPWICAAIATMAMLAEAHAEGEGLSARAERVPWARFDARIVYTGAPSWRSELAPFERSGLKVGSLLGDVYFGSAPADKIKAASGGFRATSGLILGAHPALASANAGGGLYGAARRPFGAPATAALGAAEQSGEGATVPYLGVGYSNAWPKSGWRFSADVGVISLSPGGASGIGRVIGGSQSLDELVRDMRLAPVLQLGVSYSF